MELLDYKITPFYPKFPIQRQTIINTINPHSYCVAKKDRDFKGALLEGDYLLPDGIGIVYAARVLKGENIKKIAGFDIFLYLMQDLNKTNGRCFFIGTSQNTLNLIKEKVGREYPNVKVSIYSPPYKPEFSECESRKICAKVNNQSPDVLFVGMTAPKQEKWVHKYKHQLDTNIICSIGGVFDFYAGTVKRSHPFWIKLGLEWLPRLIREPKRLFYRNFVSTPKFILEVVWFKLFGRGIL